MYCTETMICRPLYDSDDIIASLKTKVAVYSPALKQTITRNFLWSARFTLDNTYKPVARGEVYIVAGCLARAIHCLVQVLYTLNKTYYISEKKLAADVSSFRIVPERFLERVYAVLGNVGSNGTQLQESLSKVEALYTEVARLKW